MNKYFVCLGCLLAMGLVSCHQEAPEIPFEELYLRSFIQKYGLIDPTQDFSSAKQTSVTVNIPGGASLVNVYAQVGDEYYRVGCFADLEGSVSLPIDVSEATEKVMVDVDGVRYYTVPEGSVNVRSGAVVAASRAISDSYDLAQLWIDPAQWNSVTAVNGESSENYTSGYRVPIVIGSDGVMSGSGIADGYFDVTKAGHVGANLVTGTTRKTELGNHSHVGEVGNTSEGANVRFLIDNQDVKLSAYKFTFRTASKNDAKVRVAILGEHNTTGGTDAAGTPLRTGLYLFLDQTLTIESNMVDGAQGTGTYDTGIEGYYTEWELRTDMMPKGKYELIIYGVEATRNADGQNYAGNWGFMKIERLSTAKDMRWILACEDLGTTDDFDFNDVVFSIEAVNTNYAAINLGVIRWEVIENPNEDGTILHAPSRMPNGYQTQVRVTALAAGGTLPIWLHYRETNGTDYIICPSYYKADPSTVNSGLIKAISIASSEEAKDLANESLGDGCNEWHRWFGASTSEPMINTGYTYSGQIEGNVSGESVTFYTNQVFSLENFCYIQYGYDDADGKYPYKDTGDPWANKVLQWQWQMEHSQDVTFGFFLTVYHPLVGDSSSGSKGKIISKSMDGLPPQMFLIPDCDPMRKSGYQESFGWQWPCERQDITEVYPNFKSWVEDGNSYDGANWFMVPLPGLVPEDFKLYPRDPSKFPSFPFKDQLEDSSTTK